MVSSNPEIKIPESLKQNPESKEELDAVAELESPPDPESKEELDAGTELETQPGELLELNDEQELVVEEEEENEVHSPLNKWTLKNTGEELPFGTFSYEEVVERIIQGDLNVITTWVRSEIGTEDGFVEITPWILLFQEMNFNHCIKKRLKEMDGGRSNFLKDPEWIELLEGLSEEEKEEFKKIAA